MSPPPQKKIGKEIVVSPATKILHSNKKNELLVHVKTWMNLTDMIFSKGNLNIKENTLWSQSYEEKVKIIYSDPRQNRTVVTLGAKVLTGSGKTGAVSGAEHVLYFDG